MYFVIIDMIYFEKKLPEVFDRIEHYCDEWTEWFDNKSQNIEKFIVVDTLKRVCILFGRFKSQGTIDIFVIIYHAWDAFS